MSGRRKTKNDVEKYGTDWAESTGSFNSLVRRRRIFSCVERNGLRYMKMVVHPYYFHVEYHGEK